MSIQRAVLCRTGLFSCAGFPSIDSRPRQICTVMGSPWTLETNICQTLLKKLGFPHAGMPPLQKARLDASGFRKILHTFLEHLYLLYGTLHARTCCIASTFKNRHGSDEVTWDKNWINSAMDMFFKKTNAKPWNLMAALHDRKIQPLMVPHLGSGAWDSHRWSSCFRGCSAGRAPSGGGTWPSAAAQGPP